MIYVTMTDKFMTSCTGKISKIVYQCQTCEDARIIEEFLKQRSDAKHVRVCSKYPSYNTKTHIVKYISPKETSEIIQEMRDAQ